MADPAAAVDEQDAVAAPAGLVPSFARSALAPLGWQPTSPYREERAVVSGASERRRAEFFGGRACAHAAVRALGGPDLPIGVGSHRQPLWPPGVVGSIAHGGRWCAAVAAPAVAARGVGLDVEPLRPLPEEVARLALTGEEVVRLPTSHELGPFAAMFAFSAKECVYKCLFPLTGWALELHDVTVDLHLDRLAFQARLGDRFRAQRPDVGDLTGRFRVSEGHLFTALFCLPSTRH